MADRCAPRKVRDFAVVEFRIDRDGFGESAEPRSKDYASPRLEIPATTNHIDGFGNLSNELEHLNFF